MAYGWDDEIDVNGSDFTLLPEGEAKFKVLDVEKAKWKGSAKIPEGTNVAKVKFLLENENGKTTVTEDFILWSTTAFKISDLHKACGLRVEGEKIKMQWGKVKGSEGRCKVGIRVYDKKDGSKGEINEIKGWIYPTDTEDLQKPSFTAPTGYTAGKF